MSDSHLVITRHTSHITTCLASPDWLQQRQIVVVVVSCVGGRGRGVPPDLDHLVLAQADQELPQGVGGEVHHPAQVTVQQIPDMWHII